MQKALSEIVNDTFNMISVDGDTSTNDSVLLLANGMAENKIIDTEDENYKKFYEALYYIMEELSKKIAGDGEGCTCLFEVRVLNALTKEDAKTMAKSVVCSSLTKQPYTDMTPTGAEYFVPWDIREQNLTLSLWIYILKVLVADFRLLRMAGQMITAKKRQQRFFQKSM